MQYWAGIRARISRKKLPRDYHVRYVLIKHVSLASSLRNDAEMVLRRAAFTKNGNVVAIILYVLTVSNALTCFLPLYNIREYS